MKRKIIFLLAVGCALLFRPESGHALTLSLCGAYDSTNPTVTDSQGTTYETSTIPTYGGGILIDQALPFFKLELETGLLSIQRKMGWTSTALGITYVNTWTLNDYQVPAMVRFTPFKFLSLGAGFVFNFGQGNVTEDQVDYSGGGNSFSGLSMSYGEANWISQDSAYEISAQVRIPMSMHWSFLVDGNYQIGIQNMDELDQTVTKINMVQILAGFSYHL
jgi:hypothetical protein